jgi:hypothetical protein
MTEDKTIRDELIEQIRKNDPTKKTLLDDHEVKIIVSALAALTIALVSGHLSEAAFVGLTGTFFGYTFGRIFNGWQDKE